MPSTLRSPVLCICNAGAPWPASPSATASNPHPTPGPGTDTSRYLSSPSSPLPNGLGETGSQPAGFPSISTGSSEAKLIHHASSGGPRAAEA